MVTDLPTSFGHSFLDLSGAGMAKKAAEKCYTESGLSSADVDVLEVRFYHHFMRQNLQTDDSQHIVIEWSE